MRWVGGRVIEYCRANRFAANLDKPAKLGRCGLQRCGLVEIASDDEYRPHEQGYVMCNDRARLYVATSYTLLNTQRCV